MNKKLCVSSVSKPPLLTLANLCQILTTIIVTIVAIHRAQATAIEANTDVEFMIHEDRLYLVGKEPTATTRECQALEKYARMHSARNKREFTLGDHCQVIADSQPIIQKGSLPSYSNKRDMNAFRNKMTTAIDISDLIPETIWKFTTNKPRDGVCYNSALVDSGLLPETDRSYVLQSVQYLLGLNGVTINPETYEFSIGPVSDSPALAKKYAFEINPSTRDSAKTKIEQVLLNDFSPGSILCIDVAPLNKTAEFAAMLSQHNSRIQTKVAEGVEYLENKGGHCLTFVTPNLIVESNKFYPYYLVNWSMAYDFYTQMKAAEDSTITMFLFKPHEDRSPFSNWYKKQIKSNEKLAELTQLARQHRSFYQSFNEINQCGYSDSVRPYSTACLNTHNDLRRSLTNFWQNTGLDVIRKDHYSDFWKARTENATPFTGSEALAFEIFKHMVYLTERLELIEPVDQQ